MKMLVFIHFLLFWKWHIGEKNGYILHLREFAARKSAF